MKNDIFVVIKDGTSKAQLIGAVNKYAINLHSDILKVVSIDNNLFLTEYDGITVTRWIANTQEFIEAMFYDEYNINKYMKIDTII